MSRHNFIEFEFKKSDGGKYRSLVNVDHIVKIDQMDKGGIRIELPDGTLHYSDVSLDKLIEAISNIFR